MQLKCSQAQKRGKDIVKIVHVTQWFNLNFTKLREYFLCAKKTEITSLFNNFFSPELPSSTIESPTTILICVLKMNENILLYVQKMNDGLTVLEWHKGE